MSIKIEVKEVEVIENRSYPYMGKNKINNRAVLFFSKNTGLILNSIGDSYSLAQFSNTLGENDYNKISGTITITCD